ncbi:MAG TPA: type III-B CRISPR module RAMP protein Cmr6 [Nitrospiraceae bacterium]|jgi:CRISPR-associated protein Cmr6|nr:type III-B CRISPR module RAMP protein Cmr6 [Nitrospiraceae bacterium]
MPIAAVPRYIQENDPEFYLSSPPGHRFLLYFPAWGENGETNQITWGMKDRVPRIDKRTKQQKVEKSGPVWEDVPNDQFACTIAACKTPQYDEERPRARKPKADLGLKPWMPVMESLLARQMTAEDRITHDSLLRLEAWAIAPFTTGLGNEHPLENGFAFLNPYGLPYLPGSGVKGVLRQAARELASGEWRETHGWSESRHYRINVGSKKDPRWLDLSMFDVLFGRETPSGESDHVRGTLSFWDVIPQIPGDSLMVEIMTPHQSHYYQQKAQAGSTTPHDSGQPNPISFLTVPPGSRFIFYVVCDEKHLRHLTQHRDPHAPDLLAQGETHWKTLLHAAFQHAFQWLGFGAKTAVGYGAMQAEPAPSTPMSAQKGTTPAVETKPKPAAPSIQAKEEQWANVTLTYNKGGGGVITVTGSAGKAEARGPQAQAVLETLSPEQAKRLEKKGSLPNLTVLVVIEGNLRTVKAVVEGASAN